MTYEKYAAWKKQIVGRKGIRSQPDSKLSVYFIGDGDAIKIGVAKNPLRRLTELQIGNPRELKLLGSFKGSYRDEVDLHMIFYGYWIHGEWFRDHAELQAVIAKCPANDNQVVPTAEVA